MTEGNGEVRELPKGWLWSNASTVCSSVRDGTHDTPKYVENGIPLVTSKNLKKGQIDFSTAKFISYEDHCQISIRSGVESGDILFAMIGTIGNPVVIEGNQEFSIKNVGLFKKNESAINSYFLSFWLSSHIFEKISEEKQLIKGTTQKFIPLGNLRALPIPLPPINEQERIVEKIEELFSDVDQGVESLKTAQKQLKVYRQAVLKWAFEGKLTEAWRSQQPTLKTGEALLAQIKAERENRYQQQLAEWEEKVREWEAIGKVGKKPSKPQELKELLSLTEAEFFQLPLLPGSWTYTYLAYTGDLGRGKSKHRPRNDPKLFGGSYPFIQTGDVKAAKGVLRKFSQTYNELGLSQSKLWAEGTLCITIAANIAETCFLGIEACFPDSIVGFTTYPKIIDSKYVDYFIQSTKAKITAFAPATAQKNINLETLENLLVPYCLAEEQEEIVQEIESRLSICDQLEATITENLQKVEALRQSILKQAFEGKLVPQDPNDEPAEKLLERIRAERQEKEPQKTSKPLR